MSKFYIRAYKNGKRIRTLGTNSKRSNGLSANEIVDNILDGELPQQNIQHCSCTGAYDNSNDTYIIQLVNNRTGNKRVYYEIHIKYDAGPVKTSYHIDHYNWNGYANFSTKLQEFGKSNKNCRIYHRDFSRGIGESDIIKPSGEIIFHSPAQNKKENVLNILFFIFILTNI